MLFSAATLLLLVFAISDKALSAAPEGNAQDFDDVDINSDQVISLEEFEKWYRAQHARAPNADEKKASSIFHSHDIDRDGKLTVGEFVPLAFALSRKPLKEEESLFKRLDLNSDGVLSSAELKSEDEKLPGFINGLLSVADGNRDGQISLEEYEKVAKAFEGSGAPSSARQPQGTQVGIAQSLMVSIDSDRDGALSESEIAAFANQFNDKKKAPSAVHELFQQLDSNQDGRVSLNELEKREEKLAQFLGIQLAVPSIVPTTH